MTIKFSGVTVAGGREGGALQELRGDDRNKDGEFGGERTPCKVMREPSQAGDEGQRHE